MAIEYLYLSLKSIIIILLLPLYLMSHYFLESQISSNDEYNKELWEEHREDGFVIPAHTDSELKLNLDKTIMLNRIAVAI